MNEMDSIISILTNIVGTLFFLGLPLLFFIWLLNELGKKAIKREGMLKGLFGNDIKIYHDFPMPAALEEIVQGGLHQIIQRYREMIVKDNWLFIQPTFISLPKLTQMEDRTMAILSLFSKTLVNYSPTFVIRNKQNASLVSRYYQIQIENNELVNSELAFDDRQSLYAQKGKHLQALQIMTPELLDILRNAPFGADLIIRKNQLYYILPGEKPAETVLQAILDHSAIVERELEDNLERWSRMPGHQTELEEIKNTDLAVTLIEAYRASQKDE